MVFSKHSADTSGDAEVRRFEQMVENEAREDKKQLNHAIKGLKGAESTYKKSLKAADKAQHALDKAVKKEHTTAMALNKAHHTQDTAISDEQRAEENLNLQQQHESRLQQDLEQRRSAMEEFRKRKEEGDRNREMRLACLHSSQAGGTGGAGPADEGAEPETDLEGAQAVPVSIDGGNSGR